MIADKEQQLTNSAVSEKSLGMLILQSVFDHLQDREKISDFLRETCASLYSTWETAGSWFHWFISILRQTCFTSSWSIPPCQTKKLARKKITISSFCRCQKLFTFLWILQIWTQFFLKHHVGRLFHIKLIFDYFGLLCFVSDWISTSRFCCSRSILKIQVQPKQTKISFFPLTKRTEGP